MGNEKMTNLPGTPGWIARNSGKSSIEKEASAKDVVGRLGFGRKGYRDLMAANEKFQEVGVRHTKGEASDEDLEKAREEYEPVQKRSVRRFKTRYGIAATAPLAAGLGLVIKDKKLKEKIQDKIGKNKK